jgi:hypothetical protein
MNVQKGMTGQKLDDITALRGTPSRQMGFGAKPEAFEKNGKKYNAREAMIGMIRATCVTPSSALCAVESNTISADGPLKTEDLEKLTGAGQINLLQPGDYDGFSGQLTTMAQVGVLQQYMMVVAIQWRMDVFPVCAAVKGNAYHVSDDDGVPPLAKPVSPDAFVSGIDATTNNDFSSGTAAGSPLGIPSGLKPAIAQIGYWQDYAAYYMARALRLDWNYGLSHLFLKEAMQYTMFVPGNAQNGSASSSEQDMNQILYQGNDYYQDRLDSNQQFLQIDRSRYGNDTLALGGQSVFHPSRAYDTTDVTYGGGATKALLGGNSEWHRLGCPVLVGPGLPLGIVGTIVNQEAFRQFFKWMDPACGFDGPTPADFTESEQIAAGNSIAGAAGITGAEIGLDQTAPAAHALQVITDRVIFKFGPWSLTIAIRGVEMTRDQLAIVSDTQGLQMIAAATGLRTHPNQLWHKA